MIIDTMVMAYAVLGEPEFGQESTAVLRTINELSAPASVEAELLNVLWKWGRRGVEQELAMAIYENAARLWSDLIPVNTLWPTALTLAFTAGHSPYDTLFIAAARYRHTLLVTYDKKLLSLFPHDTVPVKDVLRA